MELFHRLLEQVAERGINRAMFPDLRMRHARVRAAPAAGKTTVLQFAGGLGADAHRRGSLAGFLVAQFAERKRRSFDVEIDAVEQRSADTRAVALNVGRRAAAFVLGIAEVAARTGIACCFIAKQRFVKVRGLKRVASLYFREPLTEKLKAVLITDARKFLF